MDMGLIILSLGSLVVLFSLHLTVKGEENLRGKNSFLSFIPMSRSRKASDES